MFASDFIARFTTHLKEALQKALSFAVLNGRDRVDPGDLVVGLLQEKGSIGAEILSKAHVTFEKAENTFRGSPKPHEPGSPITPDLSPAVKRLLEKCVLTAHLFEHKYVGTEHLLSAMLETPLPDVHDFLKEEGMNIDLAKEQLANILKSTSKFPDLSARENSEEEGAIPEEGAVLPQEAARMRAQRERRPKALDTFARDLTEADTVAKLDPVIGRDAEMERLIEILCRRVKNNPILLGDPGVGKTAIVEGLAQRLAAGDVPDSLQGKHIYAVDLALLVAGTMYRGEFEARLKQLVDEAKADPNAILFIDEIHNIVGAGSTSGSLDAANILKPALARGEIRCIGATTWNEYKKHIEPDAALERRYQALDVQEPSTDLAMRMVQGLKGRYETHHGVRFTADAVESSVRLAERYLTDRFFPDKAIDLLDEAAARVNAKRRSHESMERLRALDIALEATREAKERAISSATLVDAARAMDDEQRLQNEKKQLEKRLKQSRANDRMTVEADHIAEVVARLSNVPLSTILSSDGERLIGLEQRLRRDVVGQNKAVQSVAETIKRARLGFSDPRRPKASFLFVGPSGVGKTELARSLAREVFGRDEALVKLDMSEFAEGHSVSKLLGSPAGYVGYREGNRLADTLRKHPHAVLLFDEFEKAHFDVQHLLLQGLEDGKITDSTGRAISLRHAYVILTSNVGSEFVNKSRMGFGDASAKGNLFDDLIKERLADRFRPELLNRLDRVVVFQPLQKDALREIIRRELTAVFKRVESAQQVAYTAGEDVLEWLLTREFSLDEGARAARGIVEREITSILGKSMTEQPKKKKWTLKVTKNGLTVK